MPPENLKKGKGQGSPPSLKFCAPPPPPQKFIRKTKKIAPPFFHLRGWGPGNKKTNEKGGLLFLGGGPNKKRGGELREVV